MASRKSIDKAIANIMKWAERPKWSRERDAVLEEHLVTVADALDLTVQELYDTLVDNGYLEMVFGVVFEDFASRRFAPDDRNLIDDYVKRRGWREDPIGRRYLTALRDSVMSLYEVIDVSRGRHVDLRDLVRGGDALRVHEHLGTQSLVRWDRLAARVLPMGGKNAFSGGILLFPHDMAEDLLGVLERVKKCRLREAAKIGGKEAAAKALPPDILNEMVLAGACRSFTQVWLVKTLERLHAPPPQVRNTDGHALAFTETRFPLSPQRAKEIERRLDTASGWERDPDDKPRWTWVSDEREKWEQREGLPPDLALQDMGTIKGTVELTQDVLLFSANSIERTDEGKKVLGKLLEGLLGQPLTKIQTLEQMMAEVGERPPPPPGPDLPPEEVQRVTQAMMDRHYRACLDAPIPALGNKTPRQCARTKAGRAKVVAWLKYLENAELRGTKVGGQGAKPYDFTWMWEELKLTKYR